MKLISCVAYYRLVSQCNATEMIADYYSLVYNQIHMVRMYMLLFFIFFILSQIADCSGSSGGKKNHILAWYAF